MDSECQTCTVSSVWKVIGQAKMSLICQSTVHETLHLSDHKLIHYHRFFSLRLLYVLKVTVNWDICTYFTLLKELGSACSLGSKRKLKPYHLRIEKMQFIFMGQGRAVVFKPQKHSYRLLLFQNHCCRVHHSLLTPDVLASY